ncbi:hypothetical protein CFC21_032454 [Triticum aestivum]|uniref:Plant antimicrobial peptide domain-containing protein n=3 Tax=Triticinae TaxID=1648030 RepID=A0A9R1F047_WHEAT|nr:antimicrobial peptides-like [Triticum aestivum]KAF7019260.1 hypothetical protein CFC21_032454 [Triticum aestivum]
MVFVHKGGVWWFLFLAAVLLAAAAVGAEQEDGAMVTVVAEVEEEVGGRVHDQGNDMCDIKCQHGQHLAWRRRCVNECHRQKLHHSRRAFCEMKCQDHYHDPSRMELCVHQCMSYGIKLHADSNNDVDHHPHAWELEVGWGADDRSNDMCDIKCQHWQDPAGRRRCVNECHSREHHHPSRAFCEMKCQHHYHDPSRMELCVHQCMSYGLNDLHVGGNNGVAEHPTG